MQRACEGEVWVANDCSKKKQVADGGDTSESSTMKKRRMEGNTVNKDESVRLIRRDGLVPLNL